LLLIELRVFGKRHHHSADGDAFARREIAHQVGRVAHGHAHAPQPRVDLHVYVDWPPSALRGAVQHIADGRVHHRHDVARVHLGDVARIEGSHHQNRCLHAGIAQREGFVQFDHGEPADGTRRGECARNREQAQPIGIVLDDGEDRPPAGESRHLGGIVR
jgi:hypothetical protein